MLICTIPGWERNKKKKKVIYAAFPSKLLLICSIGLKHASGMILVQLHSFKKVQEACFKLMVQMTRLRLLPSILMYYISLYRSFISYCMWKVNHICKIS